MLRAYSSNTIFHPILKGGDGNISAYGLIYV